jgi:hypothetical protein
VLLNQSSSDNFFSSCIILPLKKLLSIVTVTVQHQQKKHIKIGLHFVRDRAALGEAKVVDIPTISQFANIFTKGLPTTIFQEFLSSLNIMPSHVSTAGVVRVRVRVFLSLSCSCISYIYISLYPLVNNIQFIKPIYLLNTLMTDLSKTNKVCEK